MNVSGLRRRLASLPPLLLAGLGVALALLGVSGWLSFRTVQTQAETADWVSHTYHVVGNLHRLYATVLGAESAQRGFSNSGKDVFVAAVDAADRSLSQQVGDIRHLINDNPEEARILDELQHAIDDRMNLIRQRIEERRQLGVAALGSTFQAGAGVRLMDRVNDCVERMAAMEERLLAQRRQAREAARQHTRLFLIVGWAMSLALLSAVFIALLRAVLRANHAEAAMQKSNQQLKEANNELRAFSYSVAHDLRAPLRAIDGFAKVAMEEAGGTINEEARQALDRIGANASMMSQLIDDLLALSKISYQPLRSSRVEMTRMAQDVFKELKEAEKDREIELEVSDLPPAVGDASLLRQVWQNLIANALKFTRKQDRARIEIGAASGGGDFVTYFVRDNGVGFDMKYAGKLFGAFQRLHRAVDFEGTGIGLALVQRIVMRHGGAVWAEGQQDAGARFAFTLPEWTGR